MNDEQRQQFIDDSCGKTIGDVEWTSDEESGGIGGYWTYVFTDGTEMSFRTMAELVRR